MAETKYALVLVRYRFTGPDNRRRRFRDWRTGLVRWRPRIDAAASRRMETAQRRVTRRAARRSRRG